MTAFTLQTPYGMIRRGRVDVRQQRLGNMKLERVPVIGRVQHSWDIPLETLSRAERTTLDTLGQTVRGRMNPVEFTDPWDTLTYDCRLAVDEVDMFEREPTRWESTVRLLEVTNFKALKAAVAAFPVLSVTAAVTQLPYEMHRRYHTLIGQQMDFSERRYEEFGVASGIQRWLVGGTALPDLDAHNLIDAWEGNLGPYEAFSFTEPETGTPYAAVHFADLEYELEFIEYNVNRCRLVVEELK